MTSSGIRLGAWDYLKWDHVRPIEKGGEPVAAKIIVYAGEEEEYFTFTLYLIQFTGWAILTRDGYCE